MEALINKHGEVIVIKKKPCVWSDKERKNFKIVDWEDDDLKSSKRSVMTLPYKQYKFPQMAPDGTVLPLIPEKKCMFSIDMKNLKDKYRKEDLCLASIKPKL